MPERAGAMRSVPATAAVRLHRDIGPRRRIEPVLGDYDPPWLDGLASYSSLRRLLRIVDPLVLLANLGGFEVTEIVVGADPGRSDKVAGISLPECMLGQIFRRPESVEDTAWRVYAGLEFPAGATFAVGLRLEIVRLLGTVYYGPGVAVDFSDEAVVVPPDLDDETRLFDRCLLLSSPDAERLDDWLPDLAEQVADDDGLRARLIADLVAAADVVAAANHVPGAIPQLPAGQLGLYAPSRWHPPRLGLPGENEADYLECFVDLGFAMVEHVMPDPEALGQFLVEETRLPPPSLSDRLRQIDDASNPDPRMRELARRCEVATRLMPPDPIVALDSWSVPRQGLRSVDLRLPYTEWLLAAAQIGAIDPMSAIGIDAVTADPVNSRGLHPWLPGGQSRHAMQIRGFASEAWIAWDTDRPRAILALTRILELLPEEDPTLELAWAGMPDEQLTRQFPGMQSWTGAELDDARAMVESLIEDQDGVEAFVMVERLRELELVVPGLDEYWLQTEPKVGPLPELAVAVQEFGRGFVDGFEKPFAGDGEALASRLWALHKVNAPWMPLLTPVIQVGAIYGAGEHVVSTIKTLFEWIAGDALTQALDALADLVDNDSYDFGALVGEATGMMAKQTAERLLAASAPGWYAFEIGRLVGPLILDTILGAVFAAYVVPEIALGASLVLKEAVEATEGVVNLRRIWGAFDRHLPDGGLPEGGGVPDETLPPPPPISALARLDQVLSAARAEWIRTGLSATARNRLFAVLENPARIDAVLSGLRLLSEVTPDDAVFQSLIRAYTTSGVKIGIPETLGRAIVRATPTTPERMLVAADFEFPAPPPLPSVAEIQDRALEVIARQANSFEELNELASAMGPRQPGNDLDRLQDIWIANKEAIGRRLVGEFGMDGELWDDGRALPVKRPPGQPPSEGRVRATLTADGRPQKVEGWLSATKGDELPGTVASEVRDAAGLPYPTDASHLFPKSLGGPPELWNLIAASGRFNKSWMAWTENRLRALFAEHGELFVQVELTWAEDELPTSITYRAYRIADHGGPELVYTDVITDLRPQVFLPTKPSLGKPFLVEPTLAGEIFGVWQQLLFRVAPEG